MKTVYIVTAIEDKRKHIPVLAFQDRQMAMNFREDFLKIIPKGKKIGESELELVCTIFSLNKEPLKPLIGMYLDFIDIGRVDLYG